MIDMQLVGPINSGVAAGGAGVATNNATTTTVISGIVYGVYIRYNDSPPAGTTDVTIATAGSAVPAVTILAVSNAATDGWFYPVVGMVDNTGAAATYDGANQIYERFPIYDTVKVTIAQANNGDSVDVWLLVC